MRAFFLSSAAIAAGAAVLVIATGVALMQASGREREMEARRLEALAPPPWAVRAKPVKMDVAAAIEVYRKGPSEDHLLGVWDAFEDLDARIAGLRHAVATTIGGERAEAEVDRIELQLHRDAEMARFEQIRERWEAALSVINALRFPAAPMPRSESAGWISSRRPEAEAARKLSAGRIEAGEVKAAGKIPARS